ncbi:MAG: hypothetical protein HKN16_04410 [Saprospiraceae bacterium]|nr:hypothetical protein [Saprospiraceae bacterium]
MYLSREEEIMIQSFLEQIPEKKLGELSLVLRHFKDLQFDGTRKGLEKLLMRRPKLIKAFDPFVKAN